MGDRMELFTGKLAVTVMLVVQVVILLVSLESTYEISIFCTGPTSSTLSWIFGSLHFAFLGLLGLGFVSYSWRAARPFYLIAILVGLTVLPVQVLLVNSQVLQCDLP